MSILVAVMMLDLVCRARLGSEGISILDSLGLRGKMREWRSEL